MTTAPKLSFDVQQSHAARTPAERERVLAAPGFGQTFTDHMVSIDYTEGQGWHDGRLTAYGPLTLDPATSVFHYAQELFEGLKAYRQENGSIVAFRPYANASRFNISARRMAMPEVPEETFVEALELLVQTDRDWVPSTEGHSLYLRPFMIATQVGLGVNYPSKSYRFMVIGSPAAAYFAGGVKPVSVWLSQDYTRAAPGGTGFAKCGGNYAAAFVAQRQAVENGCDQVVWLDAFEHRYVEEMGGMNLFFVFGDRLVTPDLTGTLLAGITRDSLLTLAADLGLAAEERKISIDEWREACASGELTEVFACGTAAVITPVGSVKGVEGGWTIGDGAPGPVTLRLRDELMGIQYGTRPDPHGWVHKIC
ncbi:branched-chain-amino-acid aminotransferase [Sphaerisporangium krabiense]|uniref:Branched-chain-amino-acid aminotransferase n=1 Tax=Sphaerisporangium krabiense TaxID=763782 RepID=A0A7W8Z5P5_9ACTN|nr:branched-chain amino acid aminotransferase [Sphaerisporangium krabiense]MBB5627815.1 branched-chain amino acid aminotransferase [Sphaerisporangium krabiense]GII61974.1 branched-chain-amino-acid aminotransferase [Sphaerisporangium krabiense]